MDLLRAQLYAALNEGQRAAYDAVMRGSNVFITGPGGTGKSFLINTIVDTMPPERKVAITALTGCAALLLGPKAKTLHSWAGIGLGRDDVETIVKNIKRRTWAKPLRNWLQTSVLIIDEVSMMTPELFEKLDAVGRRLRGSSSPFGGIQIVLVGDFFQLPPVEKGAARRLLFQSERWEPTLDEIIDLHEIVRQKDPKFQSLLNATRKGRLEPEHLELLQGRMNLSWRDQEIRPTLLFSRRAEVNMINQSNLDSLEGEKYEYKVRLSLDQDVAASKRSNPNDESVKRLIEAYDADAAYDVDLTLRVGAQVMLIYNLDPGDGLVNGSRGVVRRMVKPPEGGEPLPVVLFKNGKEVCVGRVAWPVDDLVGIKRSQVPLRLAWAGTIHKCQGATLDSALIDIGPNVFEFGQAYVALSRVKSLDSLYIWALDPRGIKAHPAVITFYEGLAAGKPN
jgi:ATP-dependent DNA helicase PIF1